ncbi:pilus assembly PilX N-terminal domain-containing protein (plasmid) [Deinococcus sp. KNUC1210]|uniref:pilus assembly PilX N-terminal domain-containing protein n=1 Tax=Deinococcus sp. KNUC1210 TaxID=2917691 RepID=UPI001EF00537|nr:pilus assembly PilX N-terminal domain-containing protein [Deinococcus sp. KNUC1210]ULH14157.1 pilus assembly PilX N-terminal domain-containing protein [Deinococcus sp. KNUC1210]
MHSEITSRPFLVRRAGVAQRRRQGVAIVTVLIFSAVLMALLASYVTMTLTESRTLKASSNGRQGFYSAEAGLNLRAELVRAKFVGYLRPIGTGPTSSTPCSSGDLGTGDMACITYHNLNGRDVVTYMTDVTTYDASGNPESGTVGPGDTYAGLNYSQYAYQVNSVTTDPTTHTKVAATLQMKFQSRLVPLFQFAAFSTKDLEFHPGVAMTLSGRVHTNANLYLNATVTLDINGKTTAGGVINRFGNDGRGCTGTVRVYSTTMGCTSVGTALTDAQLQPFNKNVLAGQQILTVPPMSSLNPDPTGNSELWAKADLRVVAVKSGGSWTFEARTSSNQRDSNATGALNTCNTTSGGSMIQIRPHTGNNSSSDTSTDGLWDGREKSGSPSWISTSRS